MKNHNNQKFCVVGAGVILICALIAIPFLAEKRSLLSLFNVSSPSEVKEAYITTMTAGAGQIVIQIQDYTKTQMLVERLGAVNVNRSGTYIDIPIDPVLYNILLYTKVGNGIREWDTIVTDKNGILYYEGNRYILTGEVDALLTFLADAEDKGTVR